MTGHLIKCPIKISKTIQNHHETPSKIMAAMAGTMAPHSMMGALSVWAEMMKGVKPSQSRWPKMRAESRLVEIGIGGWPSELGIKKKLGKF